MTINFAEKYSSNVDEVINQGTLSASGVNNDYDFVGTKTVKVYSFSTTELNDYSSSGAKRYGEPEELADEVQELTLKQVKSFTFTIDKVFQMDTPDGIRSAGKALRRQIDGVIVPELDKYRFGVMVKNAGFKSAGITTKGNAYELFLNANEKIDESEIPTAGRIAYVTPAFYNLIKLNGDFIKSSDLSQEMLINGQVGELDGVKIVKVTSKRMPEDADFIITHPMATAAPVKLEEYKIHTDPPGIAGNLVEGLLYFDAFVLNNKKCAVAVHYNLKELPVSETPSPEDSEPEDNG